MAMLVFQKKTGTGEVLPQSWDISSASYSGENAAGDTANDQGVWFKPDGTKLWAIHHGSGDTVDSYSLSTPWDLSTISPDTSVNPGHTDGKGVTFSSDGTKMYTVAAINRTVYQHDMSTPWDISTITGTTNYQMPAQSSSPQAVFWNPDGSQFYAIRSLAIHAYDAGSTWNVVGSSYDTGNTYNIPVGISGDYGVSFKPDGTKMFVAGHQSGENRVFQFTLSSGWDLTTASYDSVFFNVSPQYTLGAGSFQDLYFRTDANDFFTIGFTSGANNIHRYKT